ncbi:MAG: SDR family NAD(P)-dependent oxidoreductase [Alphaproteobacteria bacterium]
MRILVTGAGGGIGRAICMRLTADARARGEEAAVAAVDLRTGAALDESVGMLRAAGARVVPLVGNLDDPAVPERLVADAVAGLGALDVLVSNAGVNAPAPLKDLALEDWDRVMAVNTRPTWLLAKAAHPHLAATRGCIVSIASMSGMQPHTGLGAYSASKAALIILTKQIAQEWAADGIRANSVSPGFVESPMTADLYADPVVRRSRETFVPLGRIGRPEEIAAVVSFLAGPDARYVTGQNLLTDGGLCESILDKTPGRPSAGPKA